MKNIGEFTPGKTVYLSFNTRGLDGAPLTIADAVISIYKRGNTSESTSGVTLSTDYDSRTGYHVVAIDTSADGSFYAAGNDFAAVLTAGTVDSKSVVGVEVGSFSLSNRAGLRPTTADQTIVASNLDAAVSTRLASGSYTAPLDAAGTRSAVGLGSANLDSQLGDLPTNSELATALASADDAVLAQVAGVYNLIDSFKCTLDGEQRVIWALTADGAAIATQSAVDGIPTTSEFEARSLPSADYFVAGDYTSPPSAATISTQVNADLTSNHGAGSYQTATGFSTHSASDVLTAFGTGSTLTALLNRVRKNTALAGFPFRLTDSANRPAGLTGATVTATRSLDGAAFGACANAVTEISDGWYKIDLAAGDLNGNNVVLRFTATGADATELQIVSQP